VPVQHSIAGTGAESIAANIEDGISTGALAPGDALPPVRELAARLGVNANTAAAAYRLLRDRGAVETSGRRGTRVRHRPATSPRSLLGLDIPAGVRDLSTGNPDPALLPIAAVPQHDSRIPRRPVLYGEPAMSPELVDRARASLTADGVPADHLAVTSGALDGIERALSAHLRPGDRVAVEDPGWANLLDLLAALGLSVEPVRVNDDGPVVADVARVLGRGVRALVITSRAQNPTGAALSAQRAGELRGVLAGHDDVLLVEDDHCAGICGAPLHSLAGSSSHWAFVRSASKAYGPDLRVAVLAGDQRTVERVHGRLRLGPGWVSHLLQDLAVSLWSDDAADRLIHRAEQAYTSNRTRLRTALADRGVTAYGVSGLNVWIPVPDETVAITRLINSGWAAAPGSRFRIGTPAGIRVTIADLVDAEIDPLADSIAEAMHTAGRSSV
jgi:DNA-binding transcriptional MocR family regulator